jgi:hypothetical protein
MKFEFHIRVKVNQEIGENLNYIKVSFYYY